MKQWQAVILPLSLTSLMYAGSLFLKFLLLLDSWRQHTAFGNGLSFDSCQCTWIAFLGWLSSISSNVLAWRNYVVVSTIITIATCMPLSLYINFLWCLHKEIYLLTCECTCNAALVMFFYGFIFVSHMQHGNVLLCYT